MTNYVKLIYILCTHLHLFTEDGHMTQSSTHQNQS